MPRKPDHRKPHSKSGKLIKFNPNKPRLRSLKAGKDDIDQRLRNHYICESHGIIMAILTEVFQENESDRRVLKKIQRTLFTSGVPEMTQGFTREVGEAIEKLVHDFDKRVKKFLKEKPGLYEEIEANLDAEFIVEGIIRDIMVIIKTRMYTEVLGVEYGDEDIILLSSQPLKKGRYYPRPVEPDQSPSADQ